MTRTLIEQWLPSAAIGAESLRERGAASALPPTNFLHVWWARRPLTASRAAVAGSLLPAWPSDSEASADPDSLRILTGLRAEFPAGEVEYRAWYVRTLGILGDPAAGRAAIQAANIAGIRLEGNGYGYARAFTFNPDETTLERFRRLVDLRRQGGPTPVVLDPFAGGGSIPFEATRYGCEVIANELNPVASAVLAGTVELPRRLGPAFSGVIRRWGDQWARAVQTRLGAVFPRREGVSTIAYVWAHAVPCPTTGLHTPLLPDFWLARGAAGRTVAIAMDVNSEAGSYSIEIVEGGEAEQWGSRSTYRRGAAESIWTGETFSGDYIRRMARQDQLGQMLVAVVESVAGRSGRHFRPPTSEDLVAVDVASDEWSQRRSQFEVADLVPGESIDSVSNYDRGHRMYGIDRWSRMFSSRQLLTHVTALEELHRVIGVARSELTPDEVKALGLYLALALDKALDYNSRQCSWDATRLKIRNTFDKHNFNFKWAFAEFDGAHSLLPWAVSQVEDAYRGIANLASPPPGLSNGRRPMAPPRVMRGSATQLDLPDESVDAIVTDPPYYDNVMYAECSDFFYVWLKRSLRETWPEFCDLPLTDKGLEAVANRALFKEVATASPGRRKGGEGKSAVELADAHYEDLLARSFREAHRVLTRDGVMTVMFTHKRVEAWDTLGAALLDAGFSIDASWPVHTESAVSLHQAKKNAASSTIFLVCRKREVSEPGYWADLRAQVERVAEEVAERFSQEGMTGVDLTLATYGPVLSVLSERWPVYTGALAEDGQPEVLRPDAALDLAREKVAALKMRGLLGGRQVDFDRVTDWWLLAWNDFKAAEFPYDEARKLSIATHLEMDDLAKRYRVVSQGSGTVTLLAPSQRLTAGAFDLEALSLPTWLDRLHALMVVYDQDGLPAARAWLSRAGLDGDSRLADVFQAALYAVPRVRTKTGFARPEARILDSLRATLFDHVLAPPEPVVALPAQLRLGESAGEAGTGEEDMADSEADAEGDEGE